jgi:hypothetical protein
MMANRTRHVEGVEGVVPSKNVSKNAKKRASKAKKQAEAKSEGDKSEAATEVNSIAAMSVPESSAPAPSAAAPPAAEDAGPQDPAKRLRCACFGISPLLCTCQDTSLCTGAELSCLVSVTMPW